MAIDLRNRFAGIPIAELIMHTDAELIRIRRLQIIVDQVNLTHTATAYAL